MSIYVVNKKNPHAIIQIGGQIYDSWKNPRLFKSVEVQLTTNQSSKTLWKIFDPNFKFYNYFTQNNGVSPVTVNIYLGFGQNLGKPVFVGTLVNLDRNRKDTIFEIYDLGFKMKKHKRPGYKNKKNDIEIIGLLAARNGLKFSPPPDDLKLEPHRAVMQDEQNDWEHAMERARDAGLVLFVREDILYARYPAKLSSPKLELYNRKNNLLSDFRVLLKTLENEDTRPRIVKTRGRGVGGKRLEGKSSVDDDGRDNIMLKKALPSPATKKKFNRRAQAQKELDREHAYEGFVKFPFIYQDIRLDVRDTIRLLGVPKLLSNDYICDKVKYIFAPGQMDVVCDIYRDYV